jgi:hypothetical protein
MINLFDESHNKDVAMNDFTEGGIVVAVVLVLCCLLSSDSDSHE